MFTVHCPPSLLWHPAVHHSLLLLRALKQPHTLLLEAEREPAVRLPVPLLCDQHTRIKVSAPRASSSARVDGDSDSSLTCVYQPDHIFYLLSRTTPQTGEPVHCRGRELASYLDAVAVTQHLLHTWDALAVAFNTGEMEMTRQLHAGLMDMVEQLEVSIDDSTEKTSEEPLSTWPLFTALRFLVEEGGLLASAFPHLQSSYRDLADRNKLVRQHHRLVRNTVAQLSSSVPSETPMDDPAAHDPSVDMEVFAYPQRGLLLETQRRLSKYTTTTDETVSRGVSGEHGPLHKRMSGGSLGMQAVPARLPWTRQKTPLKH